MTDANPFVLALTGQSLVTDAPLEELPRLLQRSGWTREAIASVRVQRQEAGEPWPFAVPDQSIRAVGFAQFTAGLAQLRSELGVDGLVETKPADRPLNADERRLSADRPPHWG